ncbi:MAG: phosphate/phosphite/phosphonate ABC transporter substrate-binding protein [Caulobacterales bacterium]|nr:phosphate/phosphite/phosphonate ABC transporter substrate-binding protein [Caulobacterales bacterium]
MLALLAGCGNGPSSGGQGPQYIPASQAKPEVEVAYRLAIHPLHNPAKLHLTYQPLIDHLNARLVGCRVVLEASRDYAAFEAKYQARAPEIILPNPWQALQAMQVGYAVIACAGDPGDFRGIILVRKDGGIDVPADLVGKAVSYPAPTALAACIMPQSFLHAQGIDVTKDIENRYVGSQESSILNVVHGHVAAGATWPPPWRSFQEDHPEQAAQLVVRWETPPLINNAVMVRGDLPAEVSGQLRHLLVELGDSKEGQQVLARCGTARFIPATNQDYEPVRRFVERFEREVRPITAP